MIVTKRRRHPLGFIIRAWKQTILCFVSTTLTCYWHKFFSGWFIFIISGLLMINGVGSNFCRERRMMLWTGFMAINCGKWQGSRTSLCGLKEGVTATWSYILTTYGIFVGLFRKWRTWTLKSASRRFGNNSIYQQGLILQETLLTDAVGLNAGDPDAQNVQNLAA